MGRRDHWQSVYTGKSPEDVTWYQSSPAASLALIRRVSPGPDVALIDVGGGASTLVDHLLDEGYGHVEVLDIADQALAGSRERLAGQADAVTWTVADITRWQPGRTYDIWHDRAVFHFLADENDRQAYIVALKNALELTGHLVIATFAMDGPEKCSGLPVVRYDAGKLVETLGAGFSLIEQLDEAHVTPGGGTQAFSYFLLRRDL